MTLPSPWLEIYETRQDAIRKRLEDFERIPKEEYFYELAFTILTPQSSAKNADAAIGHLKRDKFFERGFDPTSYLREPSNYIRFHNVKAKRLLTIRDEWHNISTLLQNKSNPFELRETVLHNIKGVGLKEASHFLRNIGVRGLAILDRHILKHLKSLKIIGKIPKALTPKRYFAIEKKWLKYSKEVGIPMDELDLLFWSMETGEIRK